MDQLITIFAWHAFPFSFTTSVSCIMSGAVNTPYNKENASMVVQGMHGMSSDDFNTFTLGLRVLCTPSHGASPLLCLCIYIFDRSILIL